MLLSVISEHFEVKILKIALAPTLQLKETIHAI